MFFPALFYTTRNQDANTKQKDSRRLTSDAEINRRQLDSNSHYGLKPCGEQAEA